MPGSLTNPGGSAIPLTLARDRLVRVWALRERLDQGHPLTDCRNTHAVAKNAVANPATCQPASERSRTTDRPWNVFIPSNAPAHFEIRSEIAGGNGRTR